MFSCSRCLASAWTLLLIIIIGHSAIEDAILLLLLLLFMFLIDLNLHLNIEFLCTSGTTAQCIMFVIYFCFLE